MTVAILIRGETVSDIESIHAVEAAAFGRESEACLVDALRELNQGFISLVAAEGEQVIGHICFSRVTIEGQDGMFSALAPLAVLPSRQRRGIGTLLVNAGLEECHELNIDTVFVVGDPAYYSRFGFRPANGIGVKCEFDVSPEEFGVRELIPGRVLAGVLRYPSPFHRL